VSSRYDNCRYNS